jgi:uncharacterized protein YkwD
VSSVARHQQRFRSAPPEAAEPRRRPRASRVGALVAGVVVLGGLLSATPAAQASTPAEVGAANRVFALLNSQRAANHLPALAWSPALVNSAHSHNVAMGRVNVLSHQLSGERAVGDRIRAAGVNWHLAAENIGWTTNLTTAGATGMQQAMYNEKAPNDGHRQNILSRSVRYVGVDVVIGPAGKLWLTTDFADATGPSPAPAAAPHPLMCGGGPSTLRAGQFVTAGHSLCAPNRTAVLTMQADGNLVLYRNRAAAWNSHTAGTAAGGRLVAQTDGNLVLYRTNGTAAWNSRTFGQGPRELLAVQSDGNVVLYNAGKARWCTGTR